MNHSAMIEATCAAAAALAALPTGDLPPLASVALNEYNRGDGRPEVKLQLWTRPAAEQMRSALAWVFALPAGELHADPTDKPECWRVEVRGHLDGVPAAVWCYVQVAADLDAELCKRVGATSVALAELLVRRYVHETAAA